MKVCFLHDNPGYVGGAELTMGEFARAAPKGVELVDEIEDADRVVVGNCVSFDPEITGALAGKPVVWFHNDLSPWIKPGLQRWLDVNATHVFCSPLHREKYDGGGHLIPPPVDLDRFRAAAQNSNGNRQGSVCVGAWMNPGKAPERVAEWASENGGVEFYGVGPYAPQSSRAVAYEDMPALLAAFETFVFLPTAFEPFGRTVVEAWAAGCKVITNRQVGARYWIENEPDRLETAAEDFWRVVTDG